MHEEREKQHNTIEVGEREKGNNIIICSRLIAHSYMSFYCLFMTQSIVTRNLIFEQLCLRSNKRIYLSYFKLTLHININGLYLA